MAHKDTPVEEIEISLDADTPLSKKELRRIKKGKTTLEKIQKKKAKKLASAAAAVATAAEPAAQADVGDEGVETGSRETAAAGAGAGEDAPKQPKRSDFGIWIGNLSFDTTRDELVNFITAKAASISKADIARVNLPTRGTKNRGFAYVDFQNEEQLKDALTLSEAELNGRKVLIKNSKSYEGRPAKAEGATSTLSKNPPSRILFVGNLFFDTTQDLLQDHFKHCGEIVKIRMATFEDSGKCKGFAFIDFKDVEGPTAALKDRACKRLVGRPLRLEFGEDRSQRRVVPQAKRAFEEYEASSSSSSSSAAAAAASADGPRHDEQPRVSKGFQEKQERSAKRVHHSSSRPDARVTSSVALANAPRQSAAIVKSTGKKITF